MWRGKNNMLAIVLLCISSGISTARCILLVLFSILTLGPPPCIFNARTVATRTTTFGCRPETRHLMLKNFSIPMSAPNPASVTVRKHEWHEAEKPTQTSHKSKIIYLKCKYFIQMLSYFFAAPDPAGAALVERRKTMQRGAQKKKRATVYRIAVCSGKLKWEVSSQGLSKAKGPLIWRALHTGLLNTIQTKQIVHLERQPVLG